jgi:EAL domain-containing protein (putative c-di-GMP-specific phosphodiesterase class I)
MDLYEKICGLVDKYGIAPQRLKLEITETAFVLDVKRQMQLVKRLQERGFLVEMDDFGSGYSSLNSLKDIDIDVLKLDIKFFEKTDNPERGEKIIKSMVALARSLQMPVIAEGVEDERQIELLKRVGCRIVQGFYYSRPLTVEQYEAFLQTHGHEDMWGFIQELKGKEYDF